MSRTHEKANLLHADPLDAEIFAVEGSGMGLVSERYAVAEVTTDAPELITLNDEVVIVGANVIEGTDGNDVLDGTESSDLILGNAGNDLLYGFGAIDVLKGGSGNDTLFGGAGDDHLKGETGDDMLRGGDGSDILYGGSGDDELRGGDGADELYSNGGADILYGGAGDDYLAQGAAIGHPGHSHPLQIYYGGGGNDALHGGWGPNQLYGGDGSDQLRGRSRDDELYGGGGADDFYFRTADSGSYLVSEVDSILDFDDADQIYLEGSYSYAGDGVMNPGENQYSIWWNASAGAWMLPGTRRTTAAATMSSSLAMRLRRMILRSSLDPSFRHCPPGRHLAGLGLPPRTEIV